MEPRCTSVLAALALGCLVAACLVPAPVEAQRPRHAELAVLFGPPAPAIGMRGGWEFGLGAWALGAQGRLPFGPGRTGVLIPSGDLIFGPERIDWRLNADAALAFGALRLFYAGAGAAFMNREFTEDEGARTAPGLNLFAGLEFPRVRPPTRAFLEVRVTAIEGSWPVHLAVGFNWRRL